MEKKYFPRRFRVYLPLLLLFGLLVFLMPTASKFNYDYKKGEPWMYETRVAQFDFPILKTESRNIRVRKQRRRWQEEYATASISLRSFAKRYIRTCVHHPQARGADLRGLFSKRLLILPWYTSIDGLARFSCGFFVLYHIAEKKAIRAEDFYEKSFAGWRNAVLFRRA